MYLLVNLSQRDIRVMWPGGQEILPFVDLERNFPGKIYKLFERFPEIQDVVVINGPGSFTTLRIGCLCLNLIQLWRKKTLRFHPCTKKEVFEYGYQQGFLPQYGLMWIGQAKNGWELDLKEGRWEKVSIESKVESRKYKVESGNHQEPSMKYFWDESIELGHRIKDYQTQEYQTNDTIVSLVCGERILLSYGDQKLDIRDFCFSKSSEFISPEYLVEIG